MTPLHLAVSSSEPGALQTARLLLNQPNIITDIKDDAGETPLQLAEHASATMVALFSQNPDENPSTSTSVDQQNDTFPLDSSQNFPSSSSSDHMEIDSFNVK